MPDPVVLISGCSSGIGRALADTFKAAGYSVWAGARKEADLAQLSAAGFTAVALDVNDANSIELASGRLEREAGRLDVLINNAGYGGIAPLLDGGVEAMHRQFETNVYSLVGVTRACFGLLRASKGLVVNIGSVSGVLTTPFAGAYCASKAAAHALTDALRMELAPFGIGVMEVQPGAIESNFKTTPASEFAAGVLRAVGRSPRPRLLRLGNGSHSLPLMARLLPQGLLEKTLMQRFGLNRRLD